jgi:DNA-binding CsgD family transcriptional regulator
MHAGCQSVEKSLLQISFLNKIFPIFDEQFHAMKTDLEKMHQVWDNVIFENRNPTILPNVDFEEVASSVFSIGPFYYYIIDFYDQASISNISSGFTDIHGIDIRDIKNINDILSLIHPDDIDFVSQAEAKSIGLIHNNIGVEKFTRYKFSYNFRFKVADGSYKMFNHQSLILTMDENNNFIKSLNIHTNIHHLTKKNNYKCSLLGLGGEPSYINIDVFHEQDSINPEQESENTFTKREIEVIRLISDGLSTKEIGEKLFISTDTVETHRKKILRKSGCKNAAELVARSMSEGWI